MGEPVTWKVIVSMDIPTLAAIRTGLTTTYGPQPYRPAVNELVHTISSQNASDVNSVQAFDLGRRPTHAGADAHPCAFNYRALLSKV